MIKYRLVCGQGHEFEGWFASIAAYETQAGAKEISCPDCGHRDIDKAVMAPHVSAAAGDPPCNGRRLSPQFVEFLREARRALMAAMEDVGHDFPEEARKIHFGEAEARGIRGLATPAQAHELLDEGIEVFAFPRLRKDSH